MKNAYKILVRKSSRKRVWTGFIWLGIWSSGRL